MTIKDERERERYREMLERVYIAVCGDELAGIEGLVQKHDLTQVQIKDIENQIKEIKSEAKADRDLLWYNRKAESIWNAIKKQLLLIILGGIFIAVKGGSMIEYFKVKIWEILK